MKDIESRIRELFSSKINPQNGVITQIMVEDVIHTMGNPEEFDEENPEQENTGKQTNTKHKNKRVFRDVDNKKVAGVCAGLAAYLNADPVLVRLLFVILTLMSGGVILFIYLLLWILIPPAITTSQKLEMRGENITIDNIEKTIKKEYEEVKKSFNKMKESDTYKKGESYFNRIFRNKNPLLILALIVASVIIASTALHSFSTDMPTSFVSWHLPHIAFPGFLGFALILVVIGLIFKPIFKTVLYILLALILIGLTLKVIAIIFGIGLGTAFLFC